MSATPLALANFPKDKRPPYGPYPGVVDAPAHDGDTINILLDFGGRNYDVWPIRLNTVRAPELNQVGGPETRDFLQSLIPVGHFVIVQTDFKETVHTEDYSFERLVGVIWQLEKPVGIDLDMSVNDLVKQFVADHGYPPGR